ncbi:MAG TPA: CoA ester lyase [Candidatus Dormibacteraeota bacterium]|jgi:citrate lyase subunit beta/citryl-CoA lyase
MRARRSCLAVPGSNPRFHAKADQSAADQIFLDLEDSVAPGAKVGARDQVVEALRSYRFAGKVRTVRVNACDTRWCFDDIIAVVEGAGDQLDCLMIPKVEDVDHVHFVANLLNQLEWKHGLNRRIGLELQIESARGMENINAIAGASDRSETLIFGPGDFSASLRLPELTVGRLQPDYPGDFWHYFLARMVVAARANGLQPIDGPYAQVRDTEGLRTFAGRAAMLGFDGKWALNPVQVDVLNEVFSPRQEDFDKAVAILEAYRTATDVEQTGAVMLGEEMIDEASRKMAAVVAERGEAFGMTARPWSPISAAR